MKLSTMTDEELIKVSNMKKKNGCHTSEANRAQQILKTRRLNQIDVTGRNNDYDFSVDYN